MKNIEKLAKTVEAVFVLSKGVQDEIDIKELQNRIISRNNIMYKPSNLKHEDVSIGINNITLVLFSGNFGDYMEVFFKKRNRLNVVPMCFLVQIYEEQTGVEKELVIPFDLKSFWKMERAEDLLGDLFKIIWKQKSVLQNIEDGCDIIEQEQLNKVRATLELVNSLKVLPPENGKTQIHFSEMKFTVNTKNVKLDIVPLCKLLVKYYVQFITCMDDTCESFEDIITKQKIYCLESDMQKFMEKYFTSGISY